MSDTRPDLIEAIERRDAEAVSRALAEGADANRRDALGQPALWRAVGQGSRDIVSRLLAAGANPDAVTDQGNTPLMLAAARGDRKTVDALLAAGADTAHRNRWEFRPVDWASWAPNAAEMRAVLPG
jgi:hypothetical protein